MNDIGPELDELLEGEIWEPSCLAKPKKRRYRGASKRPVSHRQKIYDLFRDNPETVFTPSEIYKLFKIKHATIRKTLSDLRNINLIRYEFLNGKTLRGYYVYADPNKDVLDHNSMPFPEFHGIKLEIYHPSKYIATITGDIEKVQVLPDKISDRISQFIGPKNEEKSKRHMDVFRTVYLNRDISITVQKGKSHLVEIFMEASDKTVSFDNYMGYDEWLRLLFGEIWDCSDVKLTMLGLNRDVPAQLPEGYQNLKWQDLRDRFYIQIYQKKKYIARFEGHDFPIPKLSQKAIITGMYRSGQDIINFRESADKEELQNKLEEMEKEINDLKGLSNKQSDNIIDLTKVLKSAFNPDHPTKINPVDPNYSGYG